MARTLNKQEKMLTVHRLSVCYGPILALRRIDLEVAKGEIVALFGPNGAGKSTLLKSIMGLKVPEDGSIFFMEREIKRWNPEKITRMGIQLIPEDGGIFKTLTVEENLQLGAYHAFQSYQEQFEIVVQFFPFLKNRLKQIAGTLSGGEQRILSFSKAMMFPAQFLMIDEPSLGLSPKFIQVILDILQVLHQKGYTILVAEQNIKQFIKCSQKIYLLENGKMIWHGNQQDVQNEEEMIKAYFGI